MIYDTLAEEVSATQQGRSTVEKSVLVPSKLGNFCYKRTDSGQCL